MKQRCLLPTAFGLILMLAACRQGEAQAILTPTTEPTTQAISGPSSLDLDAPDAFKEIPGNYNIQLDFRFEGTEADGSPVEGQIQIDGLHQDDPPGTDMRYSALGDADFDGVNEMQFVELGEQDYFVNPVLGCLTLPSSKEDSPFTSMVDTGGFLSGTVQRVQPDAEINGISSYAFAITQENLDTSDASSMEVSQVSGTLYVAQEGGYVTRLLLEGSGASEMLSGSGELEGSIFYQLDFIPLDGPVSVSLPDACGNTEGGQPSQSDYPIVGDATGVAAFEGFLSYRTHSDLATVIEFYKTEMIALEWTLDNELVVENTAVLNFTRGATTVGVVISENPNSGEVSVVLAEE